MIQDKILHYVWVGGTKLPKKNEAYLRGWKSKNKDFELKRWDETNIDFTIPYIRTAFRLKRWANIANLVRLLAVYEYGGIYLDTDVKLLRSLTPLLDNTCFFGYALKTEDTDQVNNAVFGAVRKHWFIKKMIDELLEQFDGSEVANLSSPRLLTTVLKKEGLKKYSEKGTKVKDIQIYPVRTLNPFSWTEKYSKAAIKRDTFAVHFWEKRW